MNKTKIYKYNLMKRLIYYIYGKRFCHIYKSEKKDYKIYLTENKYSSLGDYFNWGKIKRYEQDSNFRFSDDKIPFVLNLGEYVYNPCTHLQYTLALYGRFLDGEIELEDFVKAVDKCIECMDEDGSFRYNFSFTYYCDCDNPFLPGWTSSMDSGHMMSLCARAYYFTHDEKYVEVANKCRDFIDTFVENDGVKCSLSELDKSFSNLFTYEEYPHRPATYTLNGFEFTLLGLFDWYDVYKDEKTGMMFRNGIKSLKILLPYFDLGSFTCYDLAHVTLKRFLPHIGVGYHSEHIVFNKIFYDIVGDDFFYQFYNKWRGYIE